MDTDEILAKYDSMVNPTNLEMNPLVVSLMNGHFSGMSETYGPAEAARLIRAALRLREQSLRSSFESVRREAERTSLNGWMRMQMSRFNNN